MTIPNIPTPKGGGVETPTKPDGGGKTGIDDLIDLPLDEKSGEGAEAQPEGGEGTGEQDPPKEPKEGEEVDPEAEPVDDKADEGNTFYQKGADGKEKAVKLDDILKDVELPLTIDGRTEYVDYDEVVRLAQIGKAAHKRFQEAATIRRENERLKRDFSSEVQDTAEKMAREMVDAELERILQGQGEKPEAASVREKVLLERLQKLEDSQRESRESQKQAVEAARESREREARAGQARDMGDRVLLVFKPKFTGPDGKVDEKLFEEFTDYTQYIAAQQLIQLSRQRGEPVSIEEGEMILRRVCKDRIGHFDGMASKIAESKIAARTKAVRTPTGTPASTSKPTEGAARKKITDEDLLNLE